MCHVYDDVPVLSGRLEEPLLDLSVSRTTFDWGIPVPLNFDQKVGESRESQGH